MPLSTVVVADDHAAACSTEGSDRGDADDGWGLESKRRKPGAPSPAANSSAQRGMAHACTTACLVAIAHVEPGVANRALDLVMNALEDGGDMLDDAAGADPKTLPLTWAVALTNAAFVIADLVNTAQAWNDAVALLDMPNIGVYYYITSSLQVRSAMLFVAWLPVCYCTCSFDSRPGLHVSEAWSMVVQACHAWLALTDAVSNAIDRATGGAQDPLASQSAAVTRDGLRTLLCELLLPSIMKRGQTVGKSALGMLQRVACGLWLWLTCCSGCARASSSVYALCSWHQSSVHPAFHSRSKECCLGKQRGAACSHGRAKRLRGRHRRHALAAAVSARFQHGTGAACLRSTTR